MHFILLIPLKLFLIKFFLKNFRQLWILKLTYSFNPLDYLFHTYIIFNSNLIKLIIPFYLGKTFEFIYPFKTSISFLKSLIIFLYSAICASTYFLFSVTLHLIFLALFAYFKVFIVSSKPYTPGDIFAIITVLQLPPNESFNILVNFESLYGTNEP